MLFYSLKFAALLATLLGAMAVFRGNRTRKSLLLAASAAFYMSWRPEFLLLLAFTAGLHYVVGIRVEAARTRTARRAILAAGLLLSLGLLAFFKYANFLASTAKGVLAAAGRDPGWARLDIALPIGISFFTFQAIGYSIDVYRGNQKACRSPLDFALFVSFFPQIVCGPISRASGLLPQFAEERPLRVDRQAYFLILRGLAKKVVVADNVAVLADAIFGQPAMWTSVTVWIAAIAYYVQIYCDFSGYTDMAIGVARLLGYDLPENFRRPYFAKSPSEFWRRWHISLSYWFRDYVFFPLGGPYGAAWHWMRNVALTFLATGLWHGASWSFVLWGGLHGAALIVYRGWEELSPRLGIKRRMKSKRPYRFAAWALMQGWILVTWIAFRVTDTDAMLLALRKFLVFDFNFSLASIGLGQVSLFSTVMILAGFLGLHALSHFTGDLDRRLATAPLSVALAASALAGLLLVLLWPLAEAPFIYFQF